MNRPDNPMSESDALLQAVIESPDDDAPRLALADWLAKHGEPERAELIRLQCYLDSPAPRDTKFETIAKIRLKSLLLARWHDFLMPFRQLGLQFGEEFSYGTPNTIRHYLQAVFRRGFIEEMTVPVGDLEKFAHHAAALFRLTPLQHLVVTDVCGQTEACDYGAYGGSPTGYWDDDHALSRLEDWRTLVRCPDFGRLRTLSLRLRIWTEEATMLAACPFLTARTTLILRRCDHPTYRAEVERILRERFGDSVRWDG